MRRIIIATFLAALAIWLAVWLVPDGEIDPYDRQQMAYKERLESLLPLADKGDPAAQFAVAEQYRKGKGVKAAPRLAARWYKRAAEKGHVRSQVMMGRLYETGEGVKQDAFRAAEWYRLAANFGKDRDAQFSLGQLHFHGRGVPHDYAEAMKWFRKAADKGHAAAQFLMGGMYEEGWAAKRNLPLAYMWYSLALRNAAQAMATNPKYDPAAARKRLIKRMTKFQISQGERQLKSWRPGRGS